jgi:hypothetical protein
LHIFRCPNVKQFTVERKRSSPLGARRRKSTILVDAGAKVVGPCRSVKDALARAGDYALAAAILDVRIGRETIAPVAEELVRRAIPFVFYTGQAETDLIGAEWPGCKIIRKPAHARSIVSAVASLLKQ